MLVAIALRRCSLSRKGKIVTIYRPALQAGPVTYHNVHESTVLFASHGQILCTEAPGCDRRFDAMEDSLSHGVEIIAKMAQDMRCCFLCGMQSKRKTVERYDCLLNFSEYWPPSILCVASHCSAMYKTQRDHGAHLQKSSACKADSEHTPGGGKSCAYTSHNKILRVAWPCVRLSRVLQDGVAAPRF